MHYAAVRLAVFTDTANFRQNSDG